MFFEVYGGILPKFYHGKVAYCDTLPIDIHFCQNIGLDITFMHSLSNTFGGMYYKYLQSIKMSERQLQPVASQILSLISELDGHSVGDFGRFCDGTFNKENDSY
jgi:hypothetical protein